MDLVEGARNLVLDYACVRRGENVCVYADTDCDPLVVEAVACAAKEVGGDVVITISSEVDDPEGSGLVDPPKIVQHALYASDVVLSIVSIFKMQWSTRSIAKALNEYGIRLAYIGPNTSDELASGWARFPAELAFSIGKNTQKALQAGSDDVTLTDGNGTHLKIRVAPEKWSGAGVRGPLKSPGSYGVIPSSTIGANRIEAVNGKVVLDFLEDFGPSHERCEWVVKDSWVIDIKGGPEAEVFKKKIFNVKNANLFSQISWGLNPKGNVAKALQPPWNQNKLGMLTRFAGVMHLGLGSTLFHQKGNPQPTSAIHTHGILLKPTLTAGDAIIIDKGRITALDDPKLREMAKRYGNPDQVLAQY